MVFKQTFESGYTRELLTASGGSVIQTLDVVRRRPAAVYSPGANGAGDAGQKQHHQAGSAEAASVSSSGSSEGSGE